MFFKSSSILDFSKKLIRFNSFVLIDCQILKFRRDAKNPMILLKLRQRFYQLKLILSTYKSKGMFLKTSSIVYLSKKLIRFNSFVLIDCQTLKFWRDAKNPTILLKFRKRFHQLKITLSTYKSIIMFFKASFTLHLCKNLIKFNSLVLINGQTWKSETQHWNTCWFFWCLESDSAVLKLFQDFQELTVHC